MLPRLATWGLGLEPSPETLAHKLTTRIHEFLLKRNYLNFTFVGGKISDVPK